MKLKEECVHCVGYKRCINTATVEVFVDIGRPGQVTDYGEPKGPDNCPFYKFNEEVSTNET